MNSFVSLLLFIFGVLVLVCFLYWAYRRKFKKIVTPCVCLVTGAPKSGKDLLQADRAPFEYKINYYVWKLIKCPIRKLLKKPMPEMPLFYVNQPFSFGKLGRKTPHPLDKNIRYVTYGLLHREERPTYKSIVWLSELTLVADQMLAKPHNKEDSLVVEVTNTELTLLCKLFGHETHGGKLFCNTQNVQDVHYAFKRVASSFYFVQKCVNIRPFFHVLYIRELLSSDNDAQNVVTTDLDNDMKIYLVPWWVHKRYDRYFLSYLTDSLPISDRKDYPKEIVSFNERYIKYGDKRQKEKK